jgi:NAD(P)-dependent dehydrogenase (short-subunit alcohol dehydrogenase family)
MVAFRPILAFLGTIGALLYVFIDLNLLSPPYRHPKPGSWILITGCSPGSLGAGVLKHFLTTSAAGIIIGGDTKGLNILATVRTEKQAHELKSWLAPYQLNSSSSSNSNSKIRIEIVKDVASKTDLLHLVSLCKQEKMILSAIVLNAGISKRSLLHELDFEETFRVNVFGVFIAVREFLPLLRDHGPGARIILIGSLASLFPRPATVAYSSAKSAIDGAADGMRRELDKEGISVSLVSPGFLKSNMCDVFPPCGDPTQYYEAIWDAVHNTRPRAKYYVGYITAIFSAWLAALIRNVIPDRILDYLVAVNA